MPIRASENSNVLARKPFFQKFTCQGKRASTYVGACIPAVVHFYRSDYYESYIYIYIFDVLQVFPSERKCYSRQQLGEHRRKGDADDKSHKGHPLCKFCDMRYFDNDELHVHLRKDHYFCHFCDADGISNEYFR